MQQCGVLYWGTCFPGDAWASLGVGRCCNGELGTRVRGVPSGPGHPWELVDAAMGRCYIGVHGVPGFLGMPGHPWEPVGALLGSWVPGAWGLPVCPGPIAALTPSPSDPSQSDPSTKDFWLNMAALTGHLQKQAEQSPAASYYNVALLKYQVGPARGESWDPWDTHPAPGDGRVSVPPQTLRDPHPPQVLAAGSRLSTAAAVCALGLLAGCDAGQR